MNKVWQNSTIRQTLVPSIFVIYSITRDNRGHVEGTTCPLLCLVSLNPQISPICIYVPYTAKHSRKKTFADFAY